MDITIIGAGYVGLVTAISLAHIGHKIRVLDLDEIKIEMLSNGVSPVEEPGLEKHLNEKTKNIIYTTDYNLACKKADYIFICVNTPENDDGSVNLEYVYRAIDEIKNIICENCILVIKSTVPVGTNDIIEDYINLNCNYNIKVVSNPEFLSQGTAIRDTLFASRIVVGTNDFLANEKMFELYEPFTKEPYNTQYLSMKRRSAEMTKYACNNFLALKISFINEIANLCEKVGANIDDVSLAMGKDNRIGDKFLKAGIGYGGSCFQKDTKALHFISKNSNEEITTIAAGIKINQKQKLRMYHKILQDFNNLEGLEISILGCSFKPETADIRESACIDNIKMFKDEYCNVKVYDPSKKALDNVKSIFNDEISYYNNIDECIKNSDIVIVITDHPEIVNYSLQRYKELMKSPNVYDGRNCYKLEEVLKYNINYISLGRERINQIV